MNNQEPSVRSVMLQLAVQRTVIETLLSIIHRHHRGDLEQVLLAARSLHLRYRDQGAPSVEAEVTAEAILELLEGAIGDPDENLTEQD